MIRFLKSIPYIQFLKLKAFFLSCALVFSATALAQLSTPPWMGDFSSKSTYQSDHVKAELVVHAPQGIVAGAEAWFGLKIEHQPDWHTYWSNPGDVGVPTRLTWTLPQGLTAGQIHWPTPKLLLISEDLIDYGYEDDLLLPVKIRVDESFDASSAEPFEVKLRADWLVCRIECIPEGADFTLKVVPNQTTLSEVNLFNAAWEQSPKELQALTAQAMVTKEGDELGSVVDMASGSDGFLTWRISGLPAHWQEKKIHLLLEEEKIASSSGLIHSQWLDGVWESTYTLSYNRKAEPEVLSAVLLLDESELINSTDAVDQYGIRITSTVSGKWPEQQIFEIPPSLLQTGGEANTSTNSPVVASSSSTTLLMALLFALLGGMLLNLMPCVFPVLSIKALSFAQSSGQERQEQKVGGVAYSAGVILTMLALASVLIALRASGMALGWGFQLQSPLFVALLAGLFLLIGLNLLSVFEIKLLLPQGLSNLKGKTPALDSFFSGIVAVLVATPCTAPFMGVALGAALMLPTWQTLAIFFALGAGLALPIALIAFVPQVARWLPNPGAWMNTFRQFMAFPMFATVLWLVWVVSLQTGNDGAIGLLAILLAIALFVWVLGWGQRTSLTSTAWKIVVIGLHIALVIGALAWFAPSLKTLSAQERAQLNTATTSWTSWSVQRVDELMAEKRPVFINFTAAWCVTCQMNKKTTLSKAEVLSAFADKGVVLLEADWTNNDPAITEELQRLGRSGVPVYALLQAGKEPILLPEVLTPNIVIDALKDLP